jgi:hypothetical protein
MKKETLLSATHLAGEKRSCGDLWLEGLFPPVRRKCITALRRFERATGEENRGGGDQPAAAFAGATLTASLP